MSLENNTNLPDLDNLPPVNNNFLDEDFSDLDSSEEAITKTNNIAQNTISNAQNQNSQDIDTDLSERVTAGPSTGQILLRMAIPLVTEYIPQALLVGAGFACFFAFPPTAIMASPFIIASPLFFAGAMWFHSDAELAALEQQKKILTERINILNGIIHLNNDIEKLQADNENGDKTAEIQAKKQERIEAGEVLKNFDRGYGIPEGAFGNSMINPPSPGNSSSPVNSPAPLVNQVVKEDKEENPSNGRIKEIISLRQQVKQLKDEFNLAQSSDASVQDLDDLEKLERTLNSNKKNLASLLMEEILDAEEKAESLVGQKEKEKELQESIKKMRAEFNELMENLPKDKLELGDNKNQVNKNQVKPSDLEDDSSSLSQLIEESDDDNL